MIRYCVAVLLAAEEEEVGLEAVVVVGTHWSDERRELISAIDLSSTWPI